MRLMALLASLIAFSGMAWAEGGARSSRWEVNSKLLDKNEGCFYVVEGHAPGLPEGTSLHVNLTTAGIGPNTLRAAFFKVVVKGNGDFSGSFHWPNKKFAPLIYNTTVELFVNTQPPGVRRTLMKEFGYPANAREVVAEEEVAHGEDDAARVAFSLAGLAEVEGLVDECNGLRQASGTIWTEKAEGWAETWAATEEPKLIEFQGKLRGFENEFVIRRESDLVHEIRNITADLIQASSRLRRGGDRFPLERVLTSLEGRLQQIKIEIASRRPLDANAVDGPQDDTPEQGENETDE